MPVGSRNWRKEEDGPQMPLLGLVGLFLPFIYTDKFNYHFKSFNVYMDTSFINNRWLLIVQGKMFLVLLFV